MSVKLNELCALVETIENDNLKNKLKSVIESFREKETIIRKNKEILFDILEKFDPLTVFRIKETENDSFIILTLEICVDMKNWRKVEIFFDLYNDGSTDSFGQVFIDNKHKFNTYWYGKDKVKWMETFIEKFNQN